MQYKTVIHNYIKIVNFKFIFNNFILLFQLADFYGCLIHSLFNAAPYEMFYLTWIIAQPPKQLCERKQKMNEHATKSNSSPTTGVFIQQVEIMGHQEGRDQDREV